MIDKHIKIDEGQNERITRSGKSISELVDMALKATEEKDVGLPSWLPGFDTDPRTIYNDLRKLDDSDFNGRLIKETYGQGLGTQHREFLLKIADSNSVYYLPLVEKYVGPLVSEENRLKAIESEVESKIAERDELIDEVDDLRAEQETQAELRRKIQELHGKLNDVNEKVNENIGKRNKLLEEISELKKARDSLITPIVKEIVGNWINEEYTLGTVLIGDAIWSYDNPYHEQTDEERTETFGKIVHFFRGMRNLSHVTPSSLIKIAQQVKEEHPEFDS